MAYQFTFGIPISDFAAHLILITHIHIQSIASLSCKHFVSLDRVYIPLDVCAQHRYFDPETNTTHYGSHVYQCDDERVVMYYWEDSDQCDGAAEYESDPLHTQHQQCSGEMCDYVTLRKYQHLHSDHDHNLCRPQDRYYFVDFSFVTNCWNTGGVIAEQYTLTRSRYVNCNEDSVSFKDYDQSDCSGNILQYDTLRSSCDNETIFSFNDTISSFSWFGAFHGIQPDRWNDTDFEITACGQNDPLLWLYLVVPVAGFCILCCCVSFICRRMRKRKASKWTDSQSTIRRTPETQLKIPQSNGLDAGLVQTWKV